MNAPELNKKLSDLLGLENAPVAITFRDTPPEGVARVESPQPAGCGYWRLAGQEDQVFFTEASDHYACAVGAHTHGVKMPPDVESELGNMIGTMVELSYLKKEEIPSIPHRKDALQCAVYAPLAKTPCDPDVVLVRGNVRQMMLMTETAQACGIAGETAAMGRPTCAVIPQSLDTSKSASSFGCIGNRVYTGLGDDEGYFAIPGSGLETFVAALDTICRANRELASFHEARVS